MKNLKLTSLLCGSVLSIVGSTAFAQQSSSTTQPGSSPSSSSPSSSATSPSSSATSPSASQYGTSDQTRSATSSSSLGSSASAMNADNNVRLSQLMNSSVQSKDGKTLGNIRDFTVDPQSGRIEFAILSLSSAGAALDTSTSARETVPSSRSSNIGTPGATAGSTAMGKLIPVPWQLFSQSSSGSHARTGVGASSALGSQNLVLNLDESKLRTAPSFESSNWNELQTGNLDQRVYSFYGVDRSSATGTAGSSITGQGSQGSSTLPGSTTSPHRSSTSPQGSSTTPHDSSTTPHDSSSTSPQGSSTSPQGSSTSPQGSSSTSPQE